MGNGISIKAFQGREHEDENEDKVCSMRQMGADATAVEKSYTNFLAMKHERERVDKRKKSPGRPVCVYGARMQL